MTQNQLLTLYAIEDPFKKFLSLTYLLADRHKPLHRIGRYIDIFFDTEKLGEIRTITPLVDCECGGFGRLGVWCTFSSTWSFSRFEILFLWQTYFWGVHAVCLWAYNLRVPTLEHLTKLDKFCYLVVSLFFVLEYN